MGNATPNRKLVEDSWRQRLEDSRLRVQFARNYVKEVQRDLQEGAIPSVDGNFAFESAIRAENIALAEYNRVLRIFTDLVLRGIVPDEDASAAHG